MKHWIAGAAFGVVFLGVASESHASSPRITGIAFVDSSVTAEGSRAKLPEGTKIYPLGAKITGTEGCPTTRYRTDGLIVAVIDYSGPPTAASLAVGTRAPYQLNLDPGRTLQFLGPVFQNGVYTLKLTSGPLTGRRDEITGSFELARTCPVPQ